MRERAKLGQSVLETAHSSISRKDAMAKDGLEGLLSSVRKVEVLKLCCQNGRDILRLSSVNYLS